MVDDDPNAWLALAACRGMDVNVFFPERGDMVAYAAAKAVCAVCPVCAECLADARITADRDGIRGGLSGRERRILRSARRPMRAQHGTDAGYVAHRRRGDPPCQECRTAHTAYVKHYKANRTSA